MVKLYAESGKVKELDSEVRLVVKKFKETSGMWQEIGSILMNSGYAEKARALLQQALPFMRNKKGNGTIFKKTQGGACTFKRVQVLYSRTVCFGF